MRPIPLVFFCMFLVFNNIQAIAHPHQWVNTVFNVQIEEDVVEGVQVDWHLLLKYSLDMQNRYDKNCDGVFSPEEQIELYESAFLPIALPTFYFHLRVGDIQYASTVVEKFTAEIVNEEVLFSFYIPCKIQIVPGIPIAISAFDAGYYTSFDVHDCKVSGKSGLKYTLDFIPDATILSHGSGGQAVWGTLLFSGVPEQGRNSNSASIIPLASTLIEEDADTPVTVFQNPFTGQ